MNWNKSNIIFPPKQKQWLESLEGITFLSIYVQLKNWLVEDDKIMPAPLNLKLKIICLDGEGWYENLYKLPGDSNFGVWVQNSLSLLGSFV